MIYFCKHKKPFYRKGDFKFFSGRNQTLKIFRMVEVNTLRCYVVQSMRKKHVVWVLLEIQTFSGWLKG
jgi:hypothetical protein